MLLSVPISLTVSSFLAMLIILCFSGFCFSIGDEVCVTLTLSTCTNTFMWLDTKTVVACILKGLVLYLCVAWGRFFVAFNMFNIPVSGYLTCSVCLMPRTLCTVVTWNDSVFLYFHLHNIIAHVMICNTCM